MPHELRGAELTRQWLSKARRDLIAAERVLGSAPILGDMAVFHWQQAAEKALKAFLTWHARPFRHSHDLPYLLAECEAIDSSFLSLKKAATILNPFSTEYRYPAEAEEPTEDVLRLAEQSAREILEFVEACIPSGS